MKGMFIAVLLMAATGGAAGTARQEESAPPGTRNYTRVDATVACGGATTPEAFPELRARGIAAIVNLREAHEPGANIAEAARAAREAGLRYVHVPFNGSEPRREALEAFLAALSDPANSPAYIHCGSANRVGAVWIAKRMLIDGWDEARAVAEGEAIGLRSAALKAFVLDYVRSERAAR